MMSSRVDGDVRLKAAFATIPLMLLEIATVSKDRRGPALRTVRQLYFQSIRDAGFDETEARKWTMTIMGRLRMKLAEQALTKKKLLALPMTPMPQDKPEISPRVENECWRLAQSCTRWAADTQDRSVRSGFMAMAKELSRLGLQESIEA